MGQPSTQEDMDSNGDDKVDLATREAAQHREEASRIAVEAARRDAEETVEDDRSRDSI